MGNNNTNGATEGIEYIRSIEDSNFGPVELYRRNDIEYIMKKTFTFVNSDTASDRLRQCLTFMEKQKHASLAPVHHLTVRKCNLFCLPRVPSLHRILAARAVRGLLQLHLRQYHLNPESLING